jgi:hypothetical protein
MDPHIQQSETQRDQQEATGRIGRGRPATNLARHKGFRCRSGGDIVGGLGGATVESGCGAGVVALLFEPAEI